MATTYANPKQRAGITAEAAGALYLDKQSVGLSDPALNLDALAAGDAIQIGVVPAGHVLVPKLSTLDLPVLDTGASGTGEFSVGTSDDPDGLAPAAAGTAAVAKGVGDLAGAAIGSPLNDVPILLTCTSACTTQATTGEITGDWVLRAWDARVDG